MAVRRKDGRGKQSRQQTRSVIKTRFLKIISISHLGVVLWRKFDFVLQNQCGTTTVQTYYFATVFFPFVVLYYTLGTV